MNKIIRISQISMPLKHKEEDVIKKACRIAKISNESILGSRICRQSIDARKKENIKYLYTAELTLDSKTNIPNLKNNKDISIAENHSYLPLAEGEKPLGKPPVIIGAGPCGLFCAYLLALNGYQPILIERGKPVEERQKDISEFWKIGQLNPESNVQFGEGGAGTFSDGKLNTQVKDKSGRNHFVLGTFVECGAPKDILYSAKPHIGTDRLVSVVAAMRERIIQHGGTVLFGSKATDFQWEGNSLSAIEVNHSTWIPAEVAVLAIGHSARDTFELLHKNKISLQAKPFAVGLRAEHPQEMVNSNQYGENDMQYLPAADYKLTYHASNGRGVYTFCMCPGGYVVNASSEEGMLAVNGMSYHSRNSNNANSAVIVTVTPEDFTDNPEGNPLAGVAFQRQLEKKAWELAEGKVPQQLFGDFEENTESKGYGTFRSCVKGQSAFVNLRSLMPEELNSAFIEAMHAFSKKISDFDRTDCILTGIESRTSSPVRILRDETYEASRGGIYPSGEGAGYAGGIMSAAMDGLKTAEAIMQKYAPILQVMETEG